MCFSDLKKKKNHYIPIITEYSFPIEPVPEEVYCKALELYKTKEKFHEEMFNGYYIRVGLAIKRQTANGKVYPRILRKHCTIGFDDAKHSHGFVFDMDALANTPQEAIDEFLKKAGSI